MCLCMAANERTQPTHRTGRSFAVEAPRTGALAGGRLFMQIYYSSSFLVYVDVRQNITENDYEFWSSYSVIELYLFLLRWSRTVYRDETGSAEIVYS